MRITVGTSAQKLPAGPNDRPIIQNRGVANIAIGKNATVTMSTGLVLEPGDVFAFDTTLERIDWPAVWVIATQPLTDVRYED